MIHDTLSGIVIRGKGRGAALGFPTANLTLDSGQIQPPTGIFAGRIQLALPRPKSHQPRPLRKGAVVKQGPRSYMAAIHIGPVPTFDETDTTSSIEVHILDFDGDELYGQRLTVELIKKIRDIKKFASEEELKAAIAADCVAARQLLK